MSNQNSILSFKVSSGLKNIIGKDLISDKFIAVFELVKNSYDAGATKVNITFQNTENRNMKIIISDNGCGMTYDDIVNKWLFVAYSEKKRKNNRKSSFRNSIKREVAGAKGVGRFSCDRLGTSLELITKTDLDVFAHRINIDWNSFEIDDKQEFKSIPVEYSTLDKLPTEGKNGTTIIIDNLREEWDRDSLLKLKRSLMKLISPDVNQEDSPFDIQLIVPSEQEQDNKLIEKNNVNPDRDIVNGIIHNDIFEKLNIKTTSIEVNISENGSHITTKLYDRGEYIFSLTEKNRKYDGLNNIDIKVFYLNRSAKSSFSRQMGVTSKDYGSVFIYKNGFRINPYGDPGRDFFGIDQRKAQGWKRYLGTREIMGRILIKGENIQFIETSSRAHGFIETKAVSMLSDLFIEKVIKVLERYVVNLINWGEPLKSDPLHTILPEDIGDQIVEQFANNISQKDIVNFEYNLDIVRKKNNSNDSNIEKSIQEIEEVAEQTQNEGLSNIAQNLKKRTESIISQNIKLEEENKEKEKELIKAKEEGHARKKQIYFLNGKANQDVTNLVNGFHTIYTLTDASKGNIAFLRELLTVAKFDDKETVLSIINQIQQANEKAHKLADLAIHGSQSLKQSGNNSIYDFIRQYIDAGLGIQGLHYDLEQYDKAFECKFDPSSVGIIIDNIASNSIKARATILHIKLIEKSDYVEIQFIDNGIGLDEHMDPKALFEWGFSSNIKKEGFGIGLYHVKQLVNDMKGKVSIDTQYVDGFKLIVRLKK